MSNSEYADKRLKKIRNRIQSACRAAGRDESSVRLIGASKKQNAELVSYFAEHGLTDIGENYLQEAITKQGELADPTLCWHFIGHVQSNKTKTIATHFSWVHGVDRFKIAQRLAAQNPHREPIRLLLQLNIDAEPSKNGVLEPQAPALCAQILELQGIDLRGFMLIPKLRNTEPEKRAVFARARELLERTNQRYGCQLDTLSMGMSADLEAAIAEGSTMVRVGTDLFGERLPNS